MRSATQITVTTFGIIMGLAGLEHGLGEILQGNATPPGIMFPSWPNSAFFSTLAGEPAMSIIPNLPHLSHLPDVGDTICHKEAHWISADLFSRYHAVGGRWHLSARHRHLHWRSGDTDRHVVDRRAHSSHCRSSVFSEQSVVAVFHRLRHWLVAVVSRCKYPWILFRRR